MPLYGDEHIDYEQEALDRYNEEKEARRRRRKARKQQAAMGRGEGLWGAGDEGGEGGAGVGGGGEGGKGVGMNQHNRQEAGGNATDENKGNEGAGGEGGQDGEEEEEDWGTLVLYWEKGFTTGAPPSPRYGHQMVLLNPTTVSAQPTYGTGTGAGAGAGVGTSTNALLAQLLLPCEVDVKIAVVGGCAVAPVSELGGGGAGTGYVVPHGR